MVWTQPRRKKVASPVHIGLLTPYGGGNLGDGAIQKAVIINLKERMPNCRIYLLTLNPNRTSRIHNLPSFPLAVNPGHFWLGGFLKARMVNPGSIKHRKNKEYDANSNGQNKKKDKVGHWLCVVEKAKTYLRQFTILKKLYYIIEVILSDINHWFSGLSLLRKTDLLVVSGGGQIDEEWGGIFGHPYALFKWAILAKITRTPLAVLSVGTSKIKNASSRFFIATTLKTAKYSSYRDPQSKLLSESQGINSKSIVCPDLAFSLPISKYVKNHSDIDQPRIIGLSPIAYGNPSAWPTPDPKIYEHYVITMTNFVSKMFQRNFTVLFFCSATTDNFVSQRILLNLPVKIRDMYRNRIFLPKIDTVEELLQHMALAEYIVASRYHSILLSLFLEKPVIAISFDQKVDSLMLNHGLSPYVLNIRNIRLDSLTEGLDKLIDDKRQIREKIITKNSEFRKQLNDQFNVLTSFSFLKRHSD